MIKRQPCIVNPFRKYLLMILCLLTPIHLYATGFMRGSINSGGTLHSSNKTNAISIGNIDQRRLFVPPKPQNKVQRKEDSPQRTSGPNSSYKLGEVYTFPNPVKPGKNPTVHVELGIAESVSFMFYDISGDLVHRAELNGPPQIIDDGHGPEYAYEYTWKGDIPSGTYLCLIHSRGGGSNVLRTLTKLAVIR